MFYTYVLKSLRFRKFYTGHTDDLDERLLRHNSGRNEYTKRFRPWFIAYSEEFDTLDAAIKREKYFKSAAGRRWLKKNVNK